MHSEGTSESICRIVRQYSSLLLHLAMSRLCCPADAEDVVQEVFVRLLTARPAFRDAQHEKAWLIRTTCNLACDLRRRKSRSAALTDDALPAAAPPEASPLLSAVRALPDKYSAVIHLYYYEGYTIKEIARLLGLPAATVGTRLARGRERLRTLVEEELA